LFGVKIRCKTLVLRKDKATQCDCSYRWLKNGALLEPPPSNFLHVGNGSVKITHLTALDEGYYQCLATNSYGRAMSNVTFLQRAVLDVYDGVAVIEEKQGLEGQPFALECKPTKCVPPPSYSWRVAGDAVGMSQTAIIPNRRVQIDEYGEHS